MELEAGESDAYSSYGDTQGDGTLEGAVYGLFAATDIIHPDGKTGVVYRANNLVAVAATDKNGDASFMSNTEAPGHFYDYERGMIAETADGWAASAPKNLYTENRSYDDYTEDGRYERTYPDYETVNGNCWIGRPLFMGSYYVKELTRSEGYELSIGNRDNTLTNNGQDYDMALPTGTGYANISGRLYAEGQIALNPTGEYGDPDINELFFQAESRGTGATGFDIVLDHLPEGAKIYRLDTGKETQEVEVGTGVYEKVYLTNEDGSPKYVIAENDYQYPEYNADGSLMVEEISLNYEAQMFPAMKEQMLDVDKTKAAIESAEPAMDQAAVAAKLAEDFSADALNFLKGKVERALRASKKNTPKLYVDGKTDYSSIYVGIYDAGVREGEKDIYGVSGLTPGEPAVKTVYGSPVLTLEIPKTDGAGVPLKTGDMILSVLDFYNTNDPFKNQMTAGQPDILKRVPAGTYIMEELKAPDGYQKGMPVGISLLETKRLQRVKMIDHTTKIEIAKVDGTNSQQHRILDITARAADGESVPERSMPGENLPDRSMPDRSIPERSMPEESGTYGHGCMPGAELALFEAERVYTSDTNRYPKGYYLKKTGTKPFVYRSTDSRTGSSRELTARWITGEVPIYAEGIPEGCYLLEEQATPAGFVTSEPVEVEITNTPEVQSFVMYDDHTRIEVEKYTVEGAEQKLVNGAGFTLYPAVLDTAGKVVYSDGKPLYDRNRQIDTWISRDAEYYRNFIPAFEAMYREYGCQPGTRVSWETEGKNRSATFLSAEPSELGKKHPVSAVLLFITDEREQIRIKVFGEQQKRFGKDFMYEYQFDYRKLDAINAYAASWLTLEGRRRIDYLPAGSKYVLVETTVPAGYAKAADMVIEVLDTADVQRYQIENQESRILISKAAERPDGNFTGELSRAHLGLYRAAADGSFLQDKDHLVTDWITGNDGRYTKEDKINNRIPEGYQAGDLRLHEIGRLDSGVYWLAEMASPDYYTMMEPLKFEYDQEQEIRIIRAVNVPVTGSLTVKKTDEGGAMLSGVSYELSAFHPSNLRNPVFKRQFGDLTGVVTVSGLPVGEQTDDGTIVPYTYKLRELTPPDGYAASTEVFRWKFSPNHADQNHVSYEFGEQAQQEIVVTNQKTRITISKKDFDQFGSGSGEDDIGGNPAADGGFIEEAELAVYEVTGRDGFDHLIYDENHPFAAWTTESGEQEHAMEGLIAGHSYLLKELKAPTGYQLMRPILFMISSDGRKIAEISDLMNTITVHSFGGVERDVEPEVDVNLNTDHWDADSIQSVTVRGRYAVKTVYEMTDQNGNHVAAWIGAGEEYVIDSHTAKNLGLTEGEICAITEKTCYSDGTETVTGHRTQTLHFDKEGFFRIPVRTVSDVTLSMEHSDGTLIRSFKPSELAPEINIQNNVSPENPKITMRNCDGVAGDVLDSRKAVFVTVSYMNSGHTASDIELMVDPGAGVTILEQGNGSMIGDRLVFHLDQVGTLVSGMVMFTADVSGTEGKEAAITVTMKQNGSTVVMTKEVPVLQPNRLTVFHELTGSGKKLYSDEESEILIHLYRENGEELKGTYAYSGSRTGMMKSGDTIALAGNEFITIDPGHYRNIRYRAERKADGKEYSSRYTEGTAGETAGAGVVFTRYVADTAERETFRRGEEYVLQEETAYSNGEVIESNKLGIRLDDRASISQIIATDRKTRVLVSKTGIVGREELPGNEMCIRNLDGEVLVSWVSGRKPYEIEGILEAGKTYILEEICPRKGYSYAEKIRFTIDTEGVVNQVMMQNDMTRIFVRKQDAETGETLAGAVFQIWDLEGNVLDTWISGESDNDSSGGFEMNSNNHGEFHEVTGILTAGETCILHEEQAPEGYEAGEDLEFTVPEGRETLTLTMENRKKDKPEEPDKPKEPEKPEEPDKPEKPEEPDKPQEPEKPDRPELPQKPKKIGTVSAVYHPETIGEGIIVEESGKDWRRFLPYLGDRSEMTLLSVLFGMAVLGIAVCLLSERIRKRKQDTRKDRPYNP